MAWVAFDRAVKTVEQQGHEGPVERWRRLRDEIHAEVCREGFDPMRGAFTQSYGSRKLDAALLLIPLVGFLPVDDERVVGTVDAIQRELDRDGFVSRYVADSEAADGLPPEEGVFLPCTLWLAECLALLGRHAEAQETFERVLAICNDLGLVAEEYDPDDGRQLGNFPQAFTHLAIVNTAFCLSETHPATSRLSRAG
jgi:GH15 family glucan-1,4-alpha-glucosidase